MLCAGLLALAGAAGCAPSNLAASGPPAAPARQAVRNSGTILSIRRVTEPRNPAPWRTVLLAGAGAAQAASDAGNAPVVEIIVRADGGGMLSVVQADDAGFHPGDRVIILRGEQTHLARLD